MIIDTPETKQDLQRMRWLWLGGSIVSDRSNPLVGRYRLLIRELTRLSQDVTYLEPADHPAFVEALREQGSGFYRSFVEEFPDIRYRRYDLPKSHERDVWLGREAALVDVVVIEAGAPPAVFSWLHRVPDRAFVTVMLDASPSDDHREIDVALSLANGDENDASNAEHAHVTEVADRLLRSVEEIRARRRQEDQD